MSDDDAEAWEFVPPGQERYISQQAIAEYIHYERERFVEYVIEEARTTIYADVFDTVAIRDAVSALSSEGFPQGEGARIRCFAHPGQVETFVNSTPKGYNVKLEEGLECYGAEILIDGAIPQNRVVCVHPDAIAPNIPSLATFRPWIVLYGKGVAIIELHGGSDSIARRG